MTVCSANYSPVEEAYEFLNPSLQSKTHKPVIKKACDSYSSDFDIASYANKYQQSNNSNTIDNAGLFNKTNFQHQNQVNRELQNPKKINKVTFQENRPQKIYEIEEDEDFIRQEYPHNRPDGFESSYDFQPSTMHETPKCPDMEVHIENINTNDNNNSKSVTKNYTNNYHDYDEDTILKLLSKKYMNEFTTLPQNAQQNNQIPPNYIDLILYIISGVILIFIMEQFVKIGTYLV